VAIFEEFFQDAIQLTLNRKILPGIMKNTEILFSPYSKINEAHGAALFATNESWNDILSTKKPSSAKICKDPDIHA